MFCIISLLSFGQFIIDAAMQDSLLNILFSEHISSLNVMNKPGYMCIHVCTLLN